LRIVLSLLLALLLTLDGWRWFSNGRQHASLNFAGF
jgi:hypothetical protein